MTCLMTSLWCPKCHGELYAVATPLTDMRSLLCEGCGVNYPIRDGIPRFIESSFDEGFNERWKRNPLPQATTPGVFEQKTGWKPYVFSGKTVLDAGCGCGRFSHVAHSWGAAHVVSVDGSCAAVEATHKLVPTAEVIQANLLDLPIPDASVDAAFSVGVLHHTGNTRAAFLELARTVKPGGELAVWVYTKPATGVALAAMEFLHDITRACPPEALYAACEKHSVRLRGLYAGAWGPLEQVLRVSNSTDDSECVSDTFDWHTPQYRDWHDAEEVAGWFAEAGFNVTWIGSFPTSLRGRKAA